MGLKGVKKRYARGWRRGANENKFARLERRREDSGDGAGRRAGLSTSQIDGFVMLGRVIAARIAARRLDAAVTHARH